MNKTKKILAGVLAIAISAGATCSIAYADLGKTDEKKEKQSSPESVSDTDRKASEVSACKDETVYVLCDKNSEIKNIVVSDWLKNSKALDSISDVSSLTDIVNVKGDEAFAQTGDEINWFADGNDIYYKGYSEKELPVDVTIQYFLDDKEVSLDSLKGKSGHVTIRWTYKNNEKVKKTKN